MNRRDFLSAAVAAAGFALSRSGFERKSGSSLLSCKERRAGFAWAGRRPSSVYVLPPLCEADSTTRSTGPPRFSSYVQDGHREGDERLRLSEVKNRQVVRPKAVGFTLSESIGNPPTGSRRARW